MPLGSPTSMNDFERNQWIKEMLQKIMDKGGNLPTAGPEFDLMSQSYAPVQPSPVKVGSQNVDKELAGSLDLTPMPPPTSPYLPMGALQKDVVGGGMSDEQINALQQMILQALSGMNQYRRDQGQ